MAKKRNYGQICCEFASNSDDSCIFRLMTGDIKIPVGNGRWVLDCGCGSGKTRCLKSLVAQRWSEGITICVPTINDAQVLVDDLIVQGVPVNEIVNLNSEEAKTMKDYRKNPQDIEIKKVIVITHPRLWMDPIEHFTRGKKWLLIDELNLFVRPMTTVRKPALLMFFYISDEESSIPLCGIPFCYAHIYDPSAMDLIYNNFIRHSKITFHSTNGILSNEKMEHTKSAVIAYLKEALQNEPLRNIKDFDVYNDIEDVKGMKVLMFDGTYDVLRLRGTTKFIDIDPIKEKYCSPIHFEEFHMPIKRKTVMQEINTSKIKSLIKPLVDIMEQQINNLDSSKAILFFVWMDAELDGKITTKDSVDEYIEPKSKHEIKLCKILCRELEKRGIDKKRFSIQYRGSGYDKGTNQFKDFAAVSFLGDWNGGKQVPSLIKRIYGGECDYVDYKASLIIQAIMRIRIRKHNGESVCVYYSSDIDRNDKGHPKTAQAMRRAYDYLIDNSAPGLISGMGMSSQLRKDLFLLKANYPEVERALINHQSRTFKIPLSELSAKLGKERRRRAYQQLINYLKKYNVTLMVQ